MQSVNTKYNRVEFKGKKRRGKHLVFSHEKGMINMKEIKLENKNVVSLNLEELPKNCVLVVGNGKIKLKELPAFGEVTIVTHQEDVKRVLISEGVVF